jgi:hypothetical protein
MATEKLYNMYSTTADLAVNMHDHCIVNPRSSSNERAAHSLGPPISNPMSCDLCQRIHADYALDVSPPAVASTLFQF